MEGSLENPNGPSKAKADALKAPADFNNTKVDGSAHLHSRARGRVPRLQGTGY